MKLLMFSICDKQTSYIFPFPAQTEQAAIRNFSVEINNNPMAKANPQDFELFCVGEFDMESGIVKAYTPNKHVVSGMSVVRKDDLNEYEQSGPVQR